MIPDGSIDAQHVRGTCSLACNQDSGLTEGDGEQDAKPRVQMNRPADGQAGDRLRCLLVSSMSCGNEGQI